MLALFSHRLAMPPGGGTDEGNYRSADVEETTYCD
jgi:hypothetical protein